MKDRLGSRDSWVKRVDRRWRFGLILFACGMMLIASGCVIFEELELEEDQELVDWSQDIAEAEAEEWSEIEGLGCEAYETEAEPGICSYVIDCDDAESCERWSEWMLAELEYWFGDLTYAEEWDVDEAASAREEDLLGTYAVRGNGLELKPDTDDEAYHAWLWERFAWIIPAEQRWMVHNFVVYDHADTMAYVLQDDTDYELWTYAANQIQATYETERVMTDIHELGHLLSLNAEQVDPYADEQGCDTLYLDEGCADENAYIYSFYLDFWEPAESDDPDDYVSEYAMESIYEDFAESWAHFVMTPRPKGATGAEQKISFFYQYEELVLLKAELLARAASWMDRYTEY